MFHSLKLKLGIRKAKKMIAGQEPGFEKTINYSKFRRFKVQMNQDEVAISWHYVMRHNGKPFWTYDKFHYNKNWELVDARSGKYPYTFTH